MAPNVINDCCVGSDQRALEHDGRSQYYLVVYIMTSQFITNLQGIIQDFLLDGFDLDIRRFLDYFIELILKSSCSLFFDKPFVADFYEYYRWYAVPGFATEAINSNVESLDVSNHSVSLPSLTNSKT